MRYLIAIALALSMFWACSPEAESPGEYVYFSGRQIDLRPYVEGFPYFGFAPYYDANRLFYFHEDSTTMLKSVSLSGVVDLSAGNSISDIDFAGRNVWQIRYRKQDANLYWIGDERNDELINLYRLNPETHELSKLTDVPYIYGWQWEPEGGRVAYVARLGDKEARLSELRLLHLDSGEERVVNRDEPEYRYTWGSPSWQPQGKGVVVCLVREADRNQGNLGYVDFSTGQMTLITDPSKPRKFPHPEEVWLSNSEFLYYSNEDGYMNVYRGNISTGSTEQVTIFTQDIGSARMATVDGRKMLCLVIGSPIESEMLLIDPWSGEILHRETLDADVTLLDSEGNRLLFKATSATRKFAIDEVDVSSDGFSFSGRVGLPGGLEEQIVHSTVEQVEYPAFDIDPATGKPRMLHAFLYSPTRPLPPDRQLVFIKSFYGGGNVFSDQVQILCQAGIYVLSPAPRGSSGFGREFESLNDKDLGGNEIIDIIYAGKYISDRLQIPPNRIGAYGGSHGGYATMRLLTFPGEINGHTAGFDWGFGVSHAGFSDIIHFYEHCNIPDWVTLEAGDPHTEAAKLRARSPLYHAGKMTGKLLLTHGTNDSRVPIEGSRQMADSLLKYGKSFTLVEFEGQGHSIKGLENTIRNYQVWFEFLESLEK